MRAITVPRPGGPEAMVLADVPEPVVGDHEVLIRVTAAGVNGADLSQRRGHYNPPPGAPDWLGLEVSGEIAAIGPDVSGWSVGDTVCALLAGGGYAEFVAVDAGLVLPVPEGVDLVEAAGLPEVAATVWSNVYGHAKLQPGETLLVHGGSSGIGSMAIQLGATTGAHVIATAGSPEKTAFCRRLGAEVAIDYTQQDFVEVVLDTTDGRGADVVLDIVGGDYLERNIRALAREGRIMEIASRRGPSTFDINHLMMKRGLIWATTLRARPLAEKVAIIAEVRSRVWPLIEAGRVRPVVDSVFPLEDAAEAHLRMESSTHIGKILLQVR
ncbi:NAD(P)H-quinone oxidoreductase [Diaminobutyricibacter tongyongensis]|uniref:NAD(P)H-quinone oxidoreductase n=1 Tax=Leifsonia tongyongensis TaxID=1268043 RepID=A0A6L9Y0J2_9MICO|nr:NAD(P)H-quinone oxidoreductase [Diaminobutyricibacter tongyongensis]